MNATLPVAVESVVDLCPFTVRRRVRWIECDPAGVVFAGRFPEFMYAALLLFKKHILGEELPGRGKQLAVDAPAKALEMVYLGSLWPDDEFDMRIYSGGSGRRTSHFLVHAVRSEGAEDVFVGRSSTIYIPGDDRTKSVEVPDQIRQRLDAYAAETGEVPQILGQVMR